MKRAFQCVLLAALVASFAMLTGCWNYQELESRYVVSGIAVDRGKQGHRYLLTFEVLDLSGAGNGGAGDGAGGQMKGKLIRSEGDTIADAVDEASKISDKELYYSDCKIVVFSKEIAAEGLTPVLDWLNRDPKPRFTVQAFVSQEETAGELFETGGQSGGVISTQISDSMEAVSTGGKSRQMHLNDVDNILLGEGEDLTCPACERAERKIRRSR
jgi:spore germination protein KC